MAQESSNIIPYKIIPKRVEEEVTIALQHYPSLQEVAIEFRIKCSLKKSFMKAQPKFGTLLKRKLDRVYIVFISEVFIVEGKELALEDIPKTVLIGWLGHELGHIMDYHSRSSLNLLGFGMLYVTSPSYVKKVERIADTNAILHDMKDYILATKNFILNHSDLSEKYKARIRKLYSSPDEILAVVKELEQ